MSEISFLNKLKKEGKIYLVHSSEEVKKSYFEKSESNLVSAKILLGNNLLEESVSLAYYSAYNLLLSLFYKAGIKSENHMASIILFNEVFELDNSFLIFAKKERIDKQYYIDFEITKEQTNDFIKKIEVFNQGLYNFISLLTNEKIKQYRNKFENLFKR